MQNKATFTRVQLQNQHLLGQERQKFDKQVHMESMKKGLNFNIVKKLPLDELNENFQGVVTKPRNTNVLSHRSNSVVNKLPAHLFSN